MFPLNSEPLNTERSRRRQLTDRSQKYLTRLLKELTIKELMERADG